MEPLPNLETSGVESDPRLSQNRTPRSRGRLPSTGVIVRRPSTAPQVLTVNDVGGLVARLSRPNTTAGRRAQLGSTPRRQYEKGLLDAATFRHQETYQLRFQALHAHIPGTWRAVNSREMKDIIQRLIKPTCSTSARADAQIYQRKVVERHKAIDMANDIGIGERRSSPPIGHSPPRGASPPHRGASPSRAASPRRSTVLGNWALTGHLTPQSMPSTPRARSPYSFHKQTLITNKNIVWTQ